MSFNLRLLSTEGWTFSIVLFMSAFIVLILLTYSLRNNHVVHFDQMILTGFHTLKTPYLDHFFSSITWMGSLWILLPLYLLLSVTLSSHIEHFEKLVGITFWGTVITVYVLKYELERKRPHFFGPIHELPIDPSFPSAHTAQITAFALGVSLALYQTYTPYQSIMTSALIFVVISVAISRMYLQVHFPTDIIAGFLVAFMWSVIAFWIVKSGVLK